MNIIFFSDESIEARFGPALAHLTQKVAWAPTFSTRNIVSLSQSREIFPITVNGIEQRNF